jgi:Peptidase family M50
MYLPHLYAASGGQLLLRLRGMQYYPTVMSIVDDLLYVNFYWGLVNLLPVWPLDGGHISRALVEHWDRHDGRRKSLILSGLVEGAIAMQRESRRAIPAYRHYRE